MKHGKEKNAERKASTLINISVKTFIQVTVLLLCLTALAIALTYIVPKGSFATLLTGVPITAHIPSCMTKRGSTR